jgi:TRAP-type C4-dicarboxylate transport system permease small subunit
VSPDYAKFPKKGASAVVRLAEKALDTLTVVLFSVMFATIIVQIVLRYVFNAPLVWTDEAAAYLFVWIAFLGWSMATRKRIHIGISFIVDKLPPRWRRALHAFWCLGTLAFALILLVVGVVITRNNVDVRMVSIDFAFWPVYLAVPIAAVYLIAYAARDLVEILRKGDIKATEAQL